MKNRFCEPRDDHAVVCGTREGRDTALDLAGVA
jgi:hypothetical protein